MECINLGRSGSGNEYIYSRTLDTLVTEKNIGLVVVMWSEFQRLDFHCKNGKWQALHYKVDDVKRHTQEWKNELTNTLTKKGYGDIVHQIERSIRLFYSLQQIMKLSEHNNIPFCQLMGSYPCGYKQRYTAAKTIIDSPYLNKIDKRLFFGWPILTPIGGWNIDTWFDKIDSGVRIKNSDLRISDDDSHPNKKGHEKIAEMLYNKIQDGILNDNI